MWKSFFKQWSTSSFMTMVLPLFIAIPFIGMGLLGIKEDTKFDQTGITATALIGETWVVESEEGSGSYYVGYTFEVAPGEEIYSERQVSSSKWSNYKRGKEFEIIYLPNRATKNRIIAEGGGYGPVWLLFGGISAFFAFIFFLRHYKKSKKFLNLYAHGVKVKAEVISIHESNTTMNDVCFKYLVFKYKDASEEMHTGESKKIHPAEIRYQVGDSIDIFYDPQNPSLYDMDEGWEWKNHS